MFLTSHVSSGRENATLTFLDVSWNHIRPQDLKVLCPAMAESSSMRALCLAWNGIGGEDAASSSSPPPKAKGGPVSGAWALVDMIKKTKSLTELDVSNCRLGAALSGELASALNSNTTLEHFVMDGNPMGLEAMQVLRSPLDSTPKTLQWEAWRLPEVPRAPKPSTLGPWASEKTESGTRPKRKNRSTGAEATKCEACRREDEEVQHGQLLL